MDTRLNTDRSREEARRAADDATPTWPGGYVSRPGAEHRNGAGGLTAGLRLAWRDRDAKVLGVLGDDASYWDARLSPGGDLAMVTIGGVNADVWIYEIARNLRTRLTFTDGDEWAGAWSPDGSTVFYSSNQGKGSIYDIYRKTVAGAEPEELLLESDRPKLPTSVSPDGRFLLFSQQDSQTGWDLFVLPLDEDEARPYPLLQTSFDEIVGMFSPDGRWVAYHSSESGRPEIYVTPFPGAGRKWQVSPEGGLWADWSADGREIFYHAVDGYVTAVTVETRGAGLAFGAPQQLFPLEPQETNLRYSPRPDGREFLTIERIGENAVQPITVVVNWTANRGE